MELERERTTPKLQEGQKLKKNNDELTSNVHKIIEINQRKEISHEKIQQRFSKLRTKRLRRNGKCLVVRSEEILANRENQYVSAEGEYERLNMNGIFHLDVKELQKIIRQSSKERLQLERHLARATEALLQRPRGSRLAQASDRGGCWQEVVFRQENNKSYGITNEDFTPSRRGLDTRER
ncbi:uncharacterized protein LOC143242024 [Tachypleus tridentatus]|uniref:uncharacterized protein LOC143242024 n=1 Tax=Tachypleus tridentatus TaxID=6853 RepID=UPI003FCF7D58